MEFPLLMKQPWRRQTSQEQGSTPDYRSKEGITEEEQRPGQRKPSSVCPAYSRTQKTHLTLLAFVRTGILDKDAAAVTNIHHHSHLFH